MGNVQMVTAFSGQRSVNEAFRGNMSMFRYNNFYKPVNNILDIDDNVTVI